MTRRRSDEASNLRPVYFASAVPRQLGGNSMSVSQELDTEYGYTGGVNVRGGGENVGSVNEQNADIKYVVSPQINKDLLLRFGFEWQRFSFGVPDGAPVPNTLQQASAVLGFDYQIADEWLLRVEVEPGIYSDFRDITWRDVDMPMVIGGAYLASPDLQWIIGLRIDAVPSIPFCRRSASVGNSPKPVHWI